MASDSSEGGDDGGAGTGRWSVGGVAGQTHPYYWCESHVWNAPVCLATTSLIFLFWATTLTMFKVIRSYSKKAERKHESSGARSNGQVYQNGSGAIGNGSASYGNGHAGGQLLAVDNRHLSHAQQAHTGFSESSSYETREHFERKVQKVKKSRGERERSRSARRDEVSDILAGSDSTSARDALLQWAKRATAGYPRVNVTNFTSSWRDGLAFNAILHRYRPNLIDWNKISDPSVSNRERLENAFAAAEREFGVQRLLDAEDVDTANPDEKSIITYVSTLYEALPHLPELSKDGLNDLISRLTRGIGITNEKLDIILQRIEEVERRVDTARPGEVERTVNDIVDELNALEHPIRGFFEDVEELKSHQHPEAGDFYTQVYGLQQRRTAYLDRLTNQLLVKLGIRTEAMLKENAARMESIRQSTFSRVEECIEWVRVRMEKLTEMEFLEDLETLEEMFEQHKVDNRDIQDFRQRVDECIARQAEVSAEDTYEYCELLRVLESEYQQLRDLSAGRMLDLDSLIAFVRAAQMELVWVSEREEIEVTRNWSDIKQLDLPMLQNYYKQLLHEMELREKQYNGVHNQGAALLNQGHPAVHVIEVYLRTMQKQWDWLLSLAKCLEEHLRDALNLKSFMEEAADAESWMEEQSRHLENNYNRTDFTLEEGERFLRELDEIKDILNKYHSVLMALTERCATISPLWQRGERISRPIVVTALCDYSDRNLNIKAGDDVTLLDNSDLIKWQIRDLSGVEGTVPSVVFRIPPPDTKLTAYLNRLLQQFEKLKKLWDKKHRMVRFNMVINTMKTIQGWDLDTFNAMDPEMRDAIMRALNDDANKLLSELDPNDPLALRLREELRRTNEHFWNLLNASQKPPEPDWASQFDERINDLLRKLEEAWRKLNDNVGKPVSRTTDDLEKVIVDHKKFEDDLQALDGEVANVKELFRQLPNPTPTQRVNNDRLNGLWEDLWDLSRMYVERIKVLEAVLNGLLEVNDIVKQHEITLNSFDDLPAALDKLRGHHAQLLEMNMVLQQQQSVIDSLNKNAALLRQHVARTRMNQSSHPDVDRLEEEVQQLNVRWENVRAQVVDRVKAAERATQIQSEYRPAYDNEIAWLDRVEETINRLRKPEELRPEEYQKELDMLAAEYAALQERTEAIENVNREGGKFIREAKGFDSRMGQFMDAVVGIHGPGIKNDFRRSKPQPKNGAQIVTEELEALNRRFAQLSSLILERRNNMQVLIQNWKRQKQDEAVQEASNRHSEISSMLTDLDEFKSTVFTECFSINLTPDSASQATNNIQNIKYSLDAWRDSVKIRLDEIDALCREQGDSLPMEQYTELREARHKLAANYDNVVRTVEGVYGRLNVITVLLLEFSTIASSSQSWITDCTRLAGDIKARSADPNQFAKQYRSAQELLESVQGGEGRLKEIGTIVRKLEHEIGLLYDEAPMGTPRTLNTDEVNQTFGRVQNDYEILLKMCQDLLQFQNRLSVLDGDVLDKSRVLDEQLTNVENNLSDFDQSRGMGPESKMKTVERLQCKAREIDDMVDQYEQSTHRLLTHLEGSGVPEEIRDEKQDDVAKAKRRHNSLVGNLQDRMNEVNMELAQNKGVKEAVASLASWVKEFERKVSGTVELPLSEQQLQFLKKDCQQNQSELESRQVVQDQLEKAADNLAGNEKLTKDLGETKQKMAKSASLLKGLRDNISDALAGEQSFTLGCESLARSCDILSNNLKNTLPRDTQRLLDCEEDLATLAGSLEGLEATASLLKNIPNTTGVERMDARVRDFKHRLGDLDRDLGAKRNRNSEAASLEKQINNLRQDAAEWLGAFDGELLELGPVSVDVPRLSKQRKQCSELSSKHRDGLGLLEELEGALTLLGEAEGAAGSRNSSVPRHLMDLMTRLNGQADLLRNRMEKINENEKKAIELEDGKKDVEDWIQSQNCAIDVLPTPSTKDELQAVTDQIEKIEKGARQERRKVEDVHLKSRELARRASLPNEADTILRADENLETKWNDMQDQLEAKTDKNKKVGQLLDACGQLEKWLATKEKMMLALGAPSTEPAVSRSQVAQLQIIKSEAEGEKSTLESLLENAEKLAVGDKNAEDLLDRIRTLTRRWKSLDEGLLSKEEAIKATDALSHTIKKLQKEIKSKLGEIESILDTTAHSPAGDIEKQLNALEALRVEHKNLNEVVKDLEENLKRTEEMDIDPANKDEIEEHVQKTKRKVNDLGQKIEGTKTAVLTALNEGAVVDEQLNSLLSVVRNASADVQQFPPIVADRPKLAEQLTAVNTLHNGLLTKEAEVPVIKALVAKQLKKKHDQELKSKCDELTKAWGPLLVATLDRKSAVEKADDLIKQFNDSEKSLSHRLQEDEKEMETVVASEEGDSVIQALQAVENVLTRRSADAEALIGLVDRIEQVAPGPDANKLKRKAENLLDDCKTLSRKAKNAAGESKKRADLKYRIDRLLSECKDTASAQESLLKNPENIHKERLGAQIAEITDFWNRRKRDLSNCGDEAKEAKIDSNELADELPKLEIRFASILSRLSDLAQSLADKKSAGQKIIEDATLEARNADNLNNEISDLDPPAYCLEELKKQKDECDDLMRQVENEQEKLKTSAEEIEKALEDRVITKPQHDSAKSVLDNAEKVLTRCQKKLEQREKKIDQVTGEVVQFEKESKALSTELNNLLEPLNSPIEVADLKKQQLELRQLKEKVKPLSDRVDDFTSDCKISIKAAGPEAKTTELDRALQSVTGAWSAVSSALANREIKVDSAAQELGRYEDAYKNLLNWLEDSEELLENQQKPSADAKAAKLQLGTYNLMLKHIEDKETSVSGFKSLIDKLVDLAPTEAEKSALKDKADGITKRYGRLLSDAQDRQGKVLEAIDLAERLAEVMTPLSSWLAKTEKRVQALSSIATASSRMEEQLQLQEELAEEIDQKADDVAVMDQLVPLLSVIVSVKDAEELEVQANQLGNLYDSLAQRVHNIRELLADVANQVGDFEHDTNALAAWLDEMEASLLHVDELAIEPDDLLEQSNILTDLAQAVTERDALVSNVVSVGKVLCKQTTTDEAIALQNRIEVLKNRYVDIMAVADEKLAHLSKAIPLSERFHEGFEVVCQWVEAVEEDLQNIDEADIATQAQLIFTLEEDVQNWRPEVEDLVAVSNQLQALSSKDRAEELYQNTVEMNRRVNQISDKVSRRAERLDVTEKQSRAVLDDLEFIVEWLADAKERLLTADPPSIDPEFLNRQLKNQRIMNEDVTLNKGKLRDVIAEAKKIARQISADSPESGALAALDEKCDLGKELVDEVSNLCMERTEHLERAKVLAEQLTLEFEELSLWLDNLEDELRGAPDVNTTTPHIELQKMNLHNSELMAAVVAYQPIINTFDKDVKAMIDVCHEKEGEKLRELADELLDRFKEIGETIRARGQGIDSVMDTTSVFEERLSKLVENLEGAADKLRETGGVSADPVVLENKLAENAAILDNLQNKKTAYNHLREDAASLLASAPEGDVAAQDVMSKLNRLEKLWGDIEQEAAHRGDYLSDVLGKAKHFWSELDDCQQAVDNLRYRLETVEPATGQPQQLQLQQAALVGVANDISLTGPRIAALKHAGDELASIIPPEEQEVVRTQVDAIQHGWATITNLFADKNRDLIQAMEEAMGFHGDLNELHGWLDQAEHHLALMPPAESLKIDEIPAALDELRLFKDDVDRHGVLKEQLAQTAATLAEGASAAQAAVVRQPINELNLRWSRLYGAMAEREHKVEMALLQMGKLSEAVGQLVDWIDRCRATVIELASSTTPRNLRNVEIQICKLAVLKNDVDAHRPSIDTLNAAARRLLKDSSDSTAAGKIDEMNQKWGQLNEDIAEIGRKMDKAKSEAESVGGELERWLSWLDDVEQQLATTRPTGGLPETAQTQMDDFRVLRAEIEQNAPTLEEYLKETGIYLLEHGNDQDSWIGRSHNQMKNKWNKVKELCQDRDKKLQLALDEAISLDDAMRDTAEWLQSAETNLTQLEPVSHILEKAEKQNVDLESWKIEVAKRKQMMAEQQTSGRRLQVYCEKKDAIPIKNGLVSLKHRFEKVVSRTNERGKLLVVAMDEARVWLNGVEQVEDCLFRVEEVLTLDAPSTSNVDRLKEHLNEIKDLQKTMAETQPYYEITKKRGSLLAERSTKPEAKQINSKNNDMAARWTALARKCVERQRVADQAVLEGGAFDEAMKDLEEWIDLELHRTETPEYQKVHGDVDTVRDLRDEENHRAAERMAKKKGVSTLMKKADEIMSKGVDEAEAVQKHSDRIRNKWSKVEDLAAEKDKALGQAEQEAFDFDLKAHAILEWLAGQEQKLKEPVKDLSVALASVTAIKKDLYGERPRKEEIIALGKALISKCHPRAEQALKHWIRVVEGRWKDVEERCGEREFMVLEEEQKEAERDTNLKQLYEFIKTKKDELAKMTSNPMAVDLEMLERMEKEYESLDFDLHEKQPDVDQAVKSARKGVNDPRGNQLQNEWKQLWLDSLGYRQVLENQRALLEEMKRLEGWKWEQWKDRYVDWNDHGKARVSDLFRRIDRSHTGNVPRNVFIDAIIASKFPTSRLEMDKVADLFDKGDGLINSKEFINALRFDIANRAKPTTDNEKINVEIEKQRSSCSCCNKYKIEKISDNHYKFGDTEIKRMVRILRSTVMVRVGGGWEPLDVFLGKHDPCRANNRTNIRIYKELAPAHAIDTMAAFTKNRSARTTSVTTPGPIMKVREKTERSIPMFPHRHERAASDLSSTESKIPRPSLGTSRSSLVDSRPPSRAGSECSDSHFQTRIPSLRGKKGSRYQPPK